MYVYGNGAVCHVLCLYIVMGWDVMPRAYTVMGWDAMSCLYTVIGQGVMYCLYTVWSAINICIHFDWACCHAL